MSKILNREVREVTTPEALASFPPEVVTFLMLTNLVLVVWMIWSNACVLVVGSRIIKSNAGRTRSSFGVVLNQGSSMVVPLLLTGLLRAIQTVLWSILLIIPGIVYSVRSLFYQVVIATEGKEYRSSLLQSRKVVLGRSWEVFWYLMGLSITIALVAIFVGIMQATLLSIDDRLFLVTTVLGNTVMGFAMMLYVLTTIVWYKELKKHRPKT